MILVPLAGYFVLSDFLRPLWKARANAYRLSADSLTLPHSGRAVSRKLPRFSAAAIPLDSFQSLEVGSFQSAQHNRPLRHGQLSVIRCVLRSIHLRINSIGFDVSNLHKLAHFTGQVLWSLASRRIERLFSERRISIDSAQDKLSQNLSTGGPNQENSRSKSDVARKNR